MKNTVRLNRLRHWLKLMQRVARSKHLSKHFDMMYWAQNFGGDAAKFADDLLKPARHNPHIACGTAACAAGWAASDPKFRRAGLYLQGDGTPNIVFETKNSLYNGCDAVEHFFGITTDEAEALTLPESYTRYSPQFPLPPANSERDITPSMVVYRLKRMIATYTEAHTRG